MSLPSGSRFGPYEIVASIGAGGMGEVYRAHDPALRRDVALKVISLPLAGDEENRVRFQREARVLASLNHPHIASVHGLAEQDGVFGLVMELVEGPSLADKLASGALPQRESLTIAHQIAEALEVAHERGIVHRDLKPANVRLTRGGGVKVLDFGVAKVLSAAGGDSATTLGATREGMAVGTPAYMSPEQARGDAVDARADIWAFGCVLYEMLTGHRAFGGRTAADTMAHVLKDDPEWRPLTAAAPPGIQRLIRRCLEKDPARRLRSMADARFEIEDAPTGEAAVLAPSREPARARNGLAIVAGLGALAIAAGAFAIGRATRADSSAPAAAIPMVLGLPEPAGETLYQFVDPLKISPDGTRIAMVTLGTMGKSRLWLRALDDITPVPVPEADGAMFPFWSPDSRSLGFCANDELKVLDLASRALKVLAPVKGPICGGTWNRDGQIVVGGFGGLRLVNASGGDLKPLTIADPSKGEIAHAYPQFLPDGRHFIFLVISSTLGRHRVAVGSTDSAESTPLFDVATMPVYADPGYLIFARGGELVAQAFDAERRVVAGDPVVLRGSPRMWTSTGARALSVSSTGALVFMTRRVVTTQLTWFERSGKPAGTLGEPGEWVHVAISPDDRTVAAERLESRTVVGRIWIIDVARNVTSLFTAAEGWSYAPVWSADGLRLAFAATRDAGGEIAAKAVDGSGGEERLLGPMGVGAPTQWTADRLLIASILSTGPSISWIGPGANAQPTVVVANASNGMISPDGRWIVYASNESGRSEVFVRALAGGRPYPVSRGGGAEPRWRSDGKELFFVSADRKLVAIPVTTGDTFTAGELQVLPIDTQPDAIGGRRTYDVTRSGQRFLVGRSAGVDPTPQIAVMLDWKALIGK